MRLPVKPDGIIDKARVSEMTAYAISHGVNYFDTAFPYHGGESERVIGRVLQAYPRESFYLFRFSKITFLAKTVICKDN